MGNYAIGSFDMELYASDHVSDRLWCAEADDGGRQLPDQIRKLLSDLRNGLRDGLCRGIQSVSRSGALGESAPMRLLPDYFLETPDTAWQDACRAERELDKGNWRGKRKNGGGADPLFPFCLWNLARDAAL